jgi:hypothetical protein
MKLQRYDMRDSWKGAYMTPTEDGDWVVAEAAGRLVLSLAYALESAIEDIEGWGGDPRLGEFDNED